MHPSRLKLAGATVVVALVLLGGAPARQAGPASNPSALTFQQRVEAQQAIEQVYWRHRSWPNRERPKPDFVQLAPRSALEAKVQDYLSKSVALATTWSHQITAS